MGIWRREEEIFRSLPEDRQANIEVVCSAYQSVMADKAYLTHPITSGKRYYDILDQYGVKSIKELENKKSGALREEIILPNISEAKQFAETVEGLTLPLIIPGIFEARKQRWGQEEYMILWLRVLTGSVKELWLSEDWQYSNGGAMEFCRGLMLQLRFIEERAHRLLIFNHKGDRVDLSEGASKLSSAIKDLTVRGHDTAKLRTELGQIAGIAAYLNDPLTSRHESAYHTNGVPDDYFWAIRSAQSVGVDIAFDPTF